MAKSNAVDVILEHVHEMVKAWDETGGDARRVYEALQNTPVGKLSWNTFRTRASVIVTAWKAGRLDTVRDLEKEIEKLQAHMSVQKQRIEELESVRNNERKKLDKQLDTPAPRRLAGWTLNRHSRGYWRGFRRIKGKLYSIHLGRTLDTKALAKLEAKNKALGVE